jgi:hypothetical protein
VRRHLFHARADQVRQPTGEIAAPTQGQTFFYFGPGVDRFHESFGGFGFIR